MLSYDKNTYRQRLQAYTGQHLIRNVLLYSWELKKSAINETNKQRIIEYLKDHVSAGSLDIADYLGLKSLRTRDYLNELIAEDIVVSEGGNKNRKYKLKTWAFRKKQGLIWLKISPCDIHGYVKTCPLFDR